MPNSSVAEKEMHSSCKGDYVGATPTGGSSVISDLTDVIYQFWSRFLRGKLMNAKS